MTIQKRPLYILLTFFTSLTGMAEGHHSPSTSFQHDTIRAHVNTMANPIGRLPESFEMAVDSLLNAKYKIYYSLDKNVDPSNTISPDTEELYRQRINAMTSAIPLSYNEAVQKCIDLYVNNRSTLLSRMLSKSAYYFPMIEDILDKNGLPIELKYLAIVESALDPTAVSRAGATGLWQFMLSTGKLYGLEINSLIDERRDPVKATEAACRYFKEMYDIYHDWLLVIASYNCGPGNVNKAIRRSGGSTDFWEIYPYLPRETRSYVPFFIAAFYAMEHYNIYDVRPSIIEMPLVTDTIQIPYRSTFKDLSFLTNVGIDTLRLLNPQYRRDIVPGNTEPQVIVLPSLKAWQFVSNRDSLYSLLESRPVETRVSTITHRVARGESLAAIARQYGVDMEDIKSWNRMRRSTVRSGQRLKIKITTEVPREPFVGESADKAILSSTSTNRQQTSTNGEGYPYGTVIGETPQKSSQSPKTQPAKTKAPQVRYHIVRSGESLYTIAKKYHTTIKAIKSANHLKTNMIKPKQRLIIP